MKLYFKSRFKLLWIFFAIFLAYSFIIRTVFVIWVWNEINHSAVNLLKIYSLGLFYDIICAIYWSIPIVLYLIFVPNRLFHSKYHKYLTYLFFFAVIYSLGFDAVAEYLFWEEFGVRFNFIAVDYLVYTHEVIGNIRESYPIPFLLFAIFIISLFVFWIVKPFLKECEHKIGFKQRFARGFLILLLPIFAFSFVDDSFSKSKNRYETNLEENGIYQLFAAFRNNVLEYKEFYKTLPTDYVIKNLRILLKTKNSTFLDSKITRLVKYNKKEKRYNVILVMVESLSAEFLGTFGNKKHLTPNLDKLIKKSLLFTNLYATGTRTVRGMEAVTLSIPPTPGRSIVKRPDNHNMYSIGFIFKKRGYENRFIYGGHGYFDNMNDFFSHNGFKIIDRTDMSNDEITFSNIWGVCDEDLFNKTLKVADEIYQNKKPFFLYLMTTSNHRPYTYPSGRIDIPSHTGRDGAVKYTDYAIGKFIKDAQKKPWFKDTIFIIIADHCASSAGKTEIPIHKYHIPLIFYAPNIIKPGKIDKLSSQIDTMPTLCGILNWTYKSKFYGNDILLDDFKERALVGNYQKLSLKRKNFLTILIPQKKVHEYKIEKETIFNSKYSVIKPNQKDINDTITYYQSASYFYKNRFNRWEN